MVLVAENGKENQLSFSSLPPSKGIMRVEIIKKTISPLVRVGRVLRYVKKVRN